MAWVWVCCIIVVFQQPREHADDQGQGNARSLNSQLGSLDTQDNGAYQDQLRKGSKRVLSRICRALMKRGSCTSQITHMDCLGTARSPETGSSASGHHRQPGVIKAACVFRAPPNLHRERRETHKARGSYIQAHRFK